MFQVYDQTVVFNYSGPCAHNQGADVFNAGFAKCLENDWEERTVALSTVVDTGWVGSKQGSLTYAYFDDAEVSQR